MRVHLEVGKGILWSGMPAFLGNDVLKNSYLSASLSGMLRGLEPEEGWLDLGETS